MQRVLRLHYKSRYETGTAFPEGTNMVRMARGMMNIIFAVYSQSAKKEKELLSQYEQHY